ncbi:MAG: RsiV family protein [Pseudomonas sp.]
MQPFNVIALGALALLLSACQSLSPPTPPIAVQRTAWEAQQDGCQGERCPLVNIDTLSFPEQPQLSALVERGLLEMTRDQPKTPLPTSLQAYQQAFLSRAESGWNSYLQAKVREQHDDLVIVELSSYLSTGGAHGMPGRGFINFDRTRQQALSLSDMLLAGQETAFWNIVERSHQAWLKSEQLDQDADFVANWPFQHSPNIALTSDALSLKYDVYSIAPYSMGHPELKVPYAQLNGILKPQYFPGGD